jgi:hypothetical protein
VIRLDGDAILELLGVYGLEDGESLAYRGNTDFLETVRVESLEDVACDLVFVDLRAVLFETEATEKVVHVVLVVLEQRHWS